MRKFIKVSLRREQPRHKLLETNAAERAVGGDLQAEITSDIGHLESVYHGLGRTKDAILIYLEEVYRTGLRWLEHKKHAVLEAIPDVQLLDRRVKKDPFRLLIELTSDVPVKQRSRYANALFYCRRMECRPHELKTYIRRKPGSIEGCARKGAAMRRNEKSL
jgi:hypothetical protein